MPVLSIVIPTYNMEAWLPVALESCLAQTHRELEILVLNDGSTDRSGEIADFYARADSRVRHLPRANAGAAMARQAGQDAAQGDFISWLDADDALEPRAAEHMLATAARDDVPLVCGNGTEFSCKTFNSRSYFPHPAASRIRWMDSPDYWKSRIVWRWIFSLPFLRTGREGGPFEHPRTLRYGGEDAVFMYDVLSHSDVFSHCGQTIYFYRQEHKPVVIPPEKQIEQLLRFTLIRERLFAGRNGERFVKPLVKLINESYWPDMQTLAPQLLFPEGGPRSPEAADLLEKTLDFGLELFHGMEARWFGAEFLAPELHPEPRLLPLAQAFMAGDRAGAREIFAGIAATPRHGINKDTPFHQWRRRLKGLISPRSRQARALIRGLEATARQRLGSLFSG